MMTPSDRDALIQKHLDGQTSAAEAAALSALLESDADARLVYLQMARTHAYLATDFAEEPRTAFGPEQPPNRPRRASRRRLVWLGLSAAVVALGVLAVVGFVFRARAETPVARLRAVSGSVQWVRGDGQAESEALVGREVGPGSLESLSVDSWAVIEYPDGTTVTATGRARLTLVGGTQKEVRLGEGRISVNAARQPVGRPLLIRTPTAALEVLGTQLNVDADSSVTLVSVNEGLVRVTRLVDGTATDVPADHQSVVSVDRHAELRALCRPQPVGVWQSRFPSGVNYGEWQSAGGTGELRAKALLLTCAKPKPLLIYVSSAAVAAEDSSPLVLGEAGRFVVRGRLAAPAEVFFGMTMNHPKGGFAGKYIAHRAADAGGAFEWAIPLADLKPLEGTFPASAVGLEIVECWCLTVHEDRGLAVRGIELQAETR